LCHFPELASSAGHAFMSRWINPTEVLEILHCAPGWLDGKSPALALRTSSLRAAVGIAWLEDRRMTGNQAAERASEMYAVMAVENEGGLSAA
ncbi:hypothetical protein EV714DRAFT_245587, partial [Schizophyllum commune]